MTRKAIWKRRLEHGRADLSTEAVLSFEVTIALRLDWINGSDDRKNWMMKKTVRVLGVRRSPNHWNVARVISVERPLFFPIHIEYPELNLRLSVVMYEGNGNWLLSLEFLMTRSWKGRFLLRRNMNRRIHALIYYSSGIDSLRYGFIYDVLESATAPQLTLQL